MQTYTSIKDLYCEEEYLNNTATCCGWIKFFRVSGGKNKAIGFAKISDGSTMDQLQLVFDTNTLDADNKTYFDQIIKTGKTGMSIKATGKVVSSPKMGQPIEMHVQTYEILGDVMDADTYPITKNHHSFEFLRTVPHLRVRTDTFLAINRIKSELRYAVTEYFRSQDFAEVQVPCITDNECESGANPFTVTTLPNTPGHAWVPMCMADYNSDFFRKHCYLTVSGQLHLEALVLGGLSRAWCMTTAFRAEPSTGPRHLAEFWMLELEMCFSTLEQNMAINEGCLKHCFRSILENCQDELELLQHKYKLGLTGMLQKYATKPFAVSTHQECVKLMLDDITAGKVTINPDKTPDGDLYVFREAPGYADDLSKDHERYITEVLFGGMPVFVRYFPAKIKAFYMPKIDEGAEIEHVDGFDLIFPEIGEVVGGSQRETSYEKLLARMKEMDVNPDNLQFYLDLRKYGTVPHGGSGIGFDRLMMICTGIFNIRDMIPFPRAYEMCYY